MPVRHQTRRQGRPYTLVLTKTEALFDRERRARRRNEEDLAWLTENGRPFHEDLRLDEAHTLTAIRNGSPIIGYHRRYVRLGALTLGHIDIPTECWSRAASTSTVPDDVRGRELHRAAAGIARMSPS